MEKKYASQYRNEGFLSGARRIYASLLDALILSVVSFCLILASSAIVGSVPSYSSKMETINRSREDMYRLEEETKLFEFPLKEDGSTNYDAPISQDEVFKKYALSHILYSYSTYQEEWDAKFTRNDDNPIAKGNEYNVASASYSSDVLAYFFVDYAKANNQNDNLFPLEGQSYESHYKTVLKNNSKGASWNYYEGEDTLPVLTFDYAHTLYRYLYFGEGGQEGLNSYNFLISQYQGVFSEAGNILFQSTRYQELYTLYHSNYASCSKIISLFSFMGYVLAFLLSILLPSLITKNGQTVGLMAFKGAVIQKDGLDVSKGQVLLRSLVSFFSFFPALFFACFFAGGLNSGWMYPLFSLGNAGISLFNITIILFIVPIVNTLVMLLRKDHRSLTELASDSIVVDTRYYVDHQCEEEARIQEAKEKDETKLYEADLPYFDSTCFKNTERDESPQDKDSN